MRCLPALVLAAGLASTLALTSCDTTKGMSMLNGLTTSPTGELTLETIVAGLKDALRVGTSNATNQAGAAGGYFNNARLHIPPPPELQKVTSTLRSLGLNELPDTFERKMNDGAEAAAQKAAPVFIDALTAMTFDDARQILNGGPTAATDYFRGKTLAKLTDVYRPIVHDQLNTVGAVKSYNDMLGRYNQIPLVPKPKSDLEGYVTTKALEGLFLLLADEETKIRQNPAARTTELLQRVFGQAKQ